MLRAWASYQIRKIAGCACTGNAGNVFPTTDFKETAIVSDPGMHHGTCAMHVLLCMSGWLTRGGGENVPGISGACATRNFPYLARGPELTMLHFIPQRVCFVYMQPCKKTYRRYFECRCPRSRPVCAGPGKYYDARCFPRDWVNYGRLWVQPPWLWRHLPQKDDANKDVPIARARTDITMEVSLDMDQIMFLMKCNLILHKSAYQQPQVIAPLRDIRCWYRIVSRNYVTLAHTGLRYWTMDQDETKLT